VLAEFEAKFAPVADAVENGEFALWVGSGISRQAPNLGELIERAFDYIRKRAIDPASAAAYMPALEEALGFAEVEPARVRARYGQPLAVWPEHDAIIGRLWARYSRVLDIRIGGTDVDFILWEAIDIRQAFEHPAPPAAEHLCIAILILEGAVEAIASANWDGFIEAAIERLSSGVQGIIQVVVDPDQLRGPAGRAVAEVPWLHRACHAGCPAPMGRQTMRNQSPLFAARSISESIFSTHQPATAKAIIIA
jgi:hypothetical protein